MRTGLWLVALTGLALVGGCAATPAPAVTSGVVPAAQTPAAAVTEIRLQAGQSASIEGAALRITFEAVENDSRCAKGETCIWEGNAAVRLTVAGASSTQEIVLHTSRRGGPGSVAHEGWAIRLQALEPVPMAGRPIAPATYVATLHVARGGADLATH